MQSNKNNNNNNNNNRTLYIFYSELCRKAILAGMLIALAGTVNLSVDNKYLGSFLFSFGLITIIIQGWWLYTGKVGVLKILENIDYLFVTLLGNFIGVLVISVIMKCTRFGENLKESARAIVDLKLQENLVSIFFLACLCGIMMYLAVDGYHKNKNLLMVISPIMIFILAGFEHSIANMFYFITAGELSLKGLIYILIMVLGNTYGSVFMKLAN